MSRLGWFSWGWGIFLGSRLVRLPSLGRGSTQRFDEVLNNIGVVEHTIAEVIIQDISTLKKG